MLCKSKHVVIIIIIIICRYLFQHAVHLLILCSTKVSNIYAVTFTNHFLYVQLLNDNFSRFYLVKLTKRILGLVSACTVCFKVAPYLPAAMWMCKEQWSLWQDHRALALPVSSEQTGLGITIPIHSLRVAQTSSGWGHGPMATLLVKSVTLSLYSYSRCQLN